MNQWKIWHNTRCSTSRQALQILEQHGIEPQIVEYLKTPPTAKELKEVLKQLQMKAIDLVRKKEPFYKEHYSNAQLTNSEWIKVLAKNPILIERPVIFTPNIVVLGRPIEKVEELFKKS